GKSKKATHPPKLVPSTHSKLELIHINLCGPMRDEAPEMIKKFIAQVQLNFNVKIQKVRSDNGTEFKNAILQGHYEKLGIMRQLSIARMPQQNGVVERQNRTLVETYRFNDNDSSAEFSNISSKEDLDNLFGPMYEEYIKKRSPEVSINFAAQSTNNNDDTPSSSLIIIEDQEAPPIVSSSEEHLSSISSNDVVKLVQEDSTDLMAILYSLHLML
ncbi:putative ribonuclease H-like domain-containing protein, partial [Tanacetum coccineum]